MGAISPAEFSAWQASRWVRGPVWDGVWILNALWLVPLAIYLGHGHSDPESGPLDGFYFLVTVLFWIGHRLSSTWLAYCTEAYRPLLRSQPVRFVVLPLLITGACFAIFLPSDAAFPWTREERVVGMAIIDYVFVTHHFAAQHFGALSLYRLRAQRASCVHTRRLDRIFALGVGGALIFVADILSGSVAYQEVWAGRWLFTDWLASNQERIREGAIMILAAVTVWMLGAEALALRRSLPRALYVIGLAVMVAVALQPRSLFLFVVVWTAQHWILATGLASRVPVGESKPISGTVRRVLHVLNAHSWAILLVLVGSSVLFMPFFEVEGNRDIGTYYGDRIFGAFATGLRTSSWVPTLIAAGFATGFVHYLLDRNVYRMSDAQVRAAACALLNPPHNLAAAPRRGIS
jgi:hypothetical protein